jgi:anthranilate/para-aminobenzoate synthase component I
MQQAKAQQLRRENRLEAARAQYRAAIESCQAAIDAGELKQEAESIRIACEAALRSLQF